MVPKNPRIVIGMYPNPDVRTYSLNTRISKAHEIFYAPYRESCKEYLEKVGSPGTEIVRELLDVVGISEVTITIHEVQIQKGKAFDWSEVEPDILSRLKKAFGRRRGKKAVIEGPWSFGLAPVRVVTPPAEDSEKDKTVGGLDNETEMEVQEDPEAPDFKPQGEES